MPRDFWNALIEPFKQLFAQPEQAEEREPVVRAARSETVTRERRRQAKGIRACEIEFGDSAVNGMVLKLSHSGADVRLPLHLKDLPDCFTLKIAPSEKYDCRILWRQGDKVKVSFV
ncbi:MAG: hypothetical protein QNJ67_19140 [Kiloniellales bacterium]|nr:hypothetical protein [Kiloniellales bacterium]